MTIEKAQDGNEAAEQIPAAEARLAVNREQLEHNLANAGELSPEKKERMLAKIKQFGSELANSSALHVTAALTAGVMLQGVVDNETYALHFDPDRIAMAAEYGAVAAGIIIVCKLGAKFIASRMEGMEDSLVSDLEKRYRLVPKNTDKAE